MKIALVYVLPVVKPKLYFPMARRFVEKYMEFPPGTTDHQLYVVVNGGASASPHQRSLFEPLVPEFIYHDNSGKDVGAYMMAAKSLRCDLLVCMGTPTRPAIAGWLDVIVRAVEDNGPGLFGPWAFHVPTPHIRTTVFAISPIILNSYPVCVDDSRRYHFEHSHESITTYTMKMGLPVLQITARGVFSIENWHHVEKSDSFFLDQHCDRV